MYAKHYLENGMIYMHTNY